VYQPVASNLDKLTVFSTVSVICAKRDTDTGRMMALTDTFVKTVKSTKPAGDKHADGGECTCW